MKLGIQTKLREVDLCYDLNGDCTDHQTLCDDAADHIDELTRMLWLVVQNAKPFTNGDIVVETTATIKLMDMLESAIERAEKLL